VIDTVRRAVFARIGQAPVPVLRYLPGNADELPSIVVGRPSAAESDATRAIVDLTVPVYVLGRTVRDDDAQAELDRTTEVVMPRLWAPWTAEGLSMRLTTVEPTVLEIGGTDVPAYTLTIVAEATYC
jgi:hypothetical protein